MKKARMLGILAALLLLTGILPVPTYAAEETQKNEAGYEQEKDDILTEDVQLTEEDMQPTEDIKDAENTEDTNDTEDTDDTQKKAEWIKSGNRWWYRHEDGSYTTAEWETIEGKNYYFDEKGWMVTGWLKLENNWYYLTSNGAMTTGWQKIKNVWYYLDQDGIMVTGWLKTEEGSYYLKANGAMATGWLKVENTWYYLKSNGAMATGWQKIGNARYYLKDNGAMATGWLKIENIWYYLKSNGAMATGWQKVGNTWYYLTSNGEMVTGWQKVGSTWYYLKESGAMATGWQKVENTWYYLKSNGAMATGWQKVGNTWYYLKSNGAMATGWQKVGSTWYYLKESGAMKTGWLQLGDKWYYLKASGAMASNCWIGNYYVNKSGVWIPDQKRGKIIAIDAGHQRKGNSAKEPIGPGASQTKPKVASGTHGKASGLNEYELTLQVSLKLRDELQARGYQVYMIRETHDVNISNAERAQMAASAGADILVRIHANGSDNTSIAGALTMAPSNNNRYMGKSLISSSQTLSRKIVDSFCAATGAKNQGVMQTDAMSGINWSTIPVSIVEMGYMTNRAEDLKMASASYQAKMVQGIANGIDAYYGA